MASLVSHAIAALGVGAFFYRPEIPKRVWIVGAACAVIPDIDVVGFRFGIRYGDLWGSLIHLFLRLSWHVLSCSWDFDVLPQL